MRKYWLAVSVIIVSVANSAWTGQDDPLSGAWEVIYGEYGPPDARVEMDCAERPVQLKLFASGRFAYVRHNTDGSFLAASAGSYTIDGDSYTETTEWSSVPAAVGTRVTFRWRLVGDTVCMTGPVEVVDPQGETVSDLTQMKELMRRAGSTETKRVACE